MHLSTVGQLAVHILRMTADGERVDTDRIVTTDMVCQAESSQTMEGYDRMRVG